MTRTLFSALLLLLPTMSTAGCRNDDDGNEDAADTDASDTEGADETGSQAERMTFWDDVAPVYFDHCVACHRDGGIAPFALDNYDDAVTWAGPSAAAVAERRMPPWLVTDDGTCGTFAGSRALPSADIEMIAAWAEGELAEGEPRDDLTTPELDELAEALDYETPDFTPEIVGGPLAEFDEYRCFVLDPGVDRDTFLTGYDVLPGNEAIVHHVLGIVLDPDAEGAQGMTNRETIESYDADSPDRAGWPCFEGAGPETTDDSIPIVWAPGQGAVEYPEGTGIEVSEGDIIVAQVHYNLADAGNIGMSDQTTVRVRYEDDVQRPGVMLLPDLFLETIFDGDPDTLPPGEASVEYTWSIPLGFVLPDFGTERLDLYGVLPHMHDFGHRIDMWLSGPDGDECAAEVLQWDFDWQLMYFYDEPLALTGDKTLTVTCDYDTRGATEPVAPGWGTQNEMCLMGLFVVPN